MVEQAIPGGVHLSTAAYTRLLARVVQAEAKVARVEAHPGNHDYMPPSGVSSGCDFIWRGLRCGGIEAFHLRAALSGDAAPRTDGDTR